MCLPFVIQHRPAVSSSNLGIILCIIIFKWHYLLQMQSSSKGKPKYLAARNYRVNGLQSGKKKPTHSGSLLFTPVCSIFRKINILDMFFHIMDLSDVSFTKGQLCFNLLAAGKENLKASSVQFLTEMMLAKWDSNAGLADAICSTEATWNCGTRIITAPDLTSLCIHSKL